MNAANRSEDHVINLTVRNFINSGIGYKYILGLMRDSLRMGKLAPDEENLFPV